MAGLLELTDDLGWAPTTWVYNSVVERLADDLQASEPDLAKALMAARTFENGGYLDLRTAPYEQIVPLAAATNRLLKSTQLAGPQSFVAPEFFPKYVRELDELCGLLQTMLGSSHSAED